MDTKRKFLIDVDDGVFAFIISTDLDVNLDEDEAWDILFELVEDYLEVSGVSYTYFNPIEITDLEEVEL